jgi:DNA-binding transcriptional regulator YiaG
VPQIKRTISKRNQVAHCPEFATLGDHLRKTRLDRGLSQSDVASILQVDTDTVTTWEMNRHQPNAKLPSPLFSS